jgi:hypothetical protein
MVYQTCCNPLCSISSDTIIEESATGVDFAGLQLTLVINKMQTHGWKHCKSCFKKTTRVKNGKSCRFCFPKSTVEFTVVTDANRVLLKRANGNCRHTQGQLATSNQSSLG